MAVAWHRAASVLLCLGLTAVLLCLGGLSAQGEDKVAFTIKDERITESSGLTRDTNSDLYWTANDSGDKGTVFGLDEDGEVTGTLNFRGAVIDVEALAMHENRLYVGDIGDNGRERQFVTVYFFDDPTPSDETIEYRAYDFSYPDGAKDAETMFVDGSGRLFFVTKGDEAGIYAAPEEPSRDGENELERVADAPAYATDGVYLPDDDLIALRTYVSIEVVDPNEDYEVVARSAVPAQQQGETLALDLDGESLLVGSEGENSEVYTVPIPQKVGDAPSGDSKPPSTESPSATPSDKQEPEPSEAAVKDSEGRQRTGTWLALGVAGLVAVVAGFVVFRAPGKRE